jgi:multidrug efflux pump subunit AcrA (membrane-fusion protein)
MNGIFLTMIKWAVSFTTVFLFVFSCKSKEEKIRPIEEKITESVYASGVVKSKNQYQAFAAVNGLVAEVFVTEGDLVKAIPSSGCPMSPLN